MRIARAALMAVLVVVVVAVAACGSSKKSTASAGSSGAATITAVDFQFTPTTLTAKAGEKVALTFENKGKAEHNFTLTDASADTDVEAGASGKVMFTAPAAGTYQFYCKYHKAKGMTGTLTVS